jgi:hypothetical protein
MSSILKPTKEDQNTDKNEENGGKPCIFVSLHMCIGDDAEGRLSPKSGLVDLLNPIDKPLIESKINEHLLALSESRKRTIRGISILSCFLKMRSKSACVYFSVLGQGFQRNKDTIRREETHALTVSMANSLASSTVTWCSLSTESMLEPIGKAG